MKRIRSLSALAKAAQERRAILIELNPEYVAIAQQRTNVTPGLALE